MPLSTGWLRHGERDEYLAYTAVVERAAAPQPAVIVLQEAGGLDPHIEDVTGRFAAAGYFAIAPDLFARDGQRPPELTRERLAELVDLSNAVPPGALADADFRAAELARRPPDLAARLGETIERVFLRGGTLPEQYLPQVRATAAWLRKSPATAGQKIGVVGFCMGGALAGLHATDDPELGAAAIFYGKSPAPALAAKIRCPVRGFYGASDQPINESVPALADAMKRAGGSFEAHVYDGAGHAFFNDGRTSYRARAARDAFARVLDFFRRELAG